MSIAEHTPTADDVPTEEHPEFGVISMHDVVISEVAHWRDGELYVFRSTEFDIIAADEDWDRAIVMFIDSADDYATMVADLPPEEITRDEAEIAVLILRRTRNAYQNRVEALRSSLAQRLRVIRLLRGRGHDATRPWYRKSSLPTSSRPPSG